MTSALRKLERDGFVTLKGFVDLLKEQYPQLQMSYPAAQRMVERGEIKTWRFKNQCRINREDVEEWIAQYEQP